MKGEKTMSKNRLMTLALVTVLGLGISMTCAQAEEVTVQVTKVALAKPDTLAYPNKILLKFDLPSVLSKSRIDYAELHFKAEFDTTLKFMGIMVHPVTSDWVEDSILSDQDVTYDKAKLSFVAVRQETLDAKLDITKMIKAWVKGSLPNKGIILRSMDKPNEALSITPISPEMKAEVQIFYTGPEAGK